MKRCFLLAALVFTRVASQASIINVAGAGNLLTAGSGVGYTADFFGDATLVIHGWNEAQNYLLTSNLAVDITTTGTFNSPGSLTPGFIPAGTVVSSHTFYLDPAAGGSAVVGFQFDGTIVGVILNDMTIPTDPFIASDFLIPGSVPSGNIPTAHFDNRGLELGANTDHLTVGVNSVTFSLSAGSPGDQVRVLTLAVPEPGMAGLLLVSGLVLLKIGRTPLTASNQTTPPACRGSRSSRRA